MRNITIIPSKYRNVTGGVLIGENIGGIPKYVYIPATDFLRHCIIVGTTGSGKTTTASTIAAQLSSYGAVLIMDWYGEYGNLLSGAQVVKPGRSAPIPIPSDEDDMVSIFEEVLELSSAQAYILQRVIDVYKPRTLSELIEYIEIYPTEAKWVIESKHALLRRVSMLLSKEKMFSIGDYRLFKLLKTHQPLVVDLSGIRNIILKRLAVVALLKAIELVKSAGGISDRVFIVLEESHNVVAMGKSLISRMLSEVRKLGIGIILITQSPSILGHSVIMNCNVRIVHALKSRDDVELMSKSIGLPKELTEVIPRLGTGMALVDSPSITSPELVKVKVHEAVPLTSVITPKSGN
ncbi:MAG: ATP-binding protein [Desulfurococcales archaeon]|nr:ATP-binding protein [Desulfurococcales archaeon]